MSFEQAPQYPEEYSEVNRALRQLIINNVVGVQAENDQHQAFFRQMQTDAAEFAATMNTLPGVWTDIATNAVEVKPQGLFSYAQYRHDEYPLWIIREGKRYGGSSLEHDRHGYRYETVMVDKIVILKTGHLALAHIFDIRGDNELNYWPERNYGADRFVDRKPFDLKDTGRRLRDEWISDLEAAARKYSRKTS